MFYCGACQKEREWPESMAMSRGACEVCGKNAVCFDVPSAQLPSRKGESLDIRDVKITPLGPDGLPNGDTVSIPQRHPFADLFATLKPIDNALLGKLVEHGAFAADTAVMDAALMGRPQAEATRRGVRQALRVLLANGLVSAVPMDEWPDSILLDLPGS